jgi:methyltransferase
MKDIIPFFVFFSIVTCQRLVELMIARRNEKWMKAQGAKEFGRKHYHLMVWMHILFFTSLCFEKLAFNRQVSSFWPFLLFFFIIMQGIRMWVLASLGKFWNTKIIVLPNVEVVKKGPYRYIKHPNYFVVSVELLVIPLLFQAYATAVFFTLFNFFILSIRIPLEEKALKELTEYGENFQERNRFIPKFVKSR